MRVTTEGEIAAFFLARAVVFAILYVASSMFLGALYLQIFRSGGALALTGATIGVGVIGWVVTLVLFILFRAAFGGVPPMTAPSAGRNAVTTSGGEIGAFFLACVGVTALVSMLNMWVMGAVYTWMRTNGLANLNIVVSFVVAAVSALIFFAIFVGLRAAIARSSAPVGAYPPPNPPGPY